MGAIVCREGGATPYTPAKFEYEAAWPCPALGDLHRSFRDLPGPEDAEVLVRVAYSSMNPADREPLPSPSGFSSSVRGRCFSN